MTAIKGACNETMKSKYQPKLQQAKGENVTNHPSEYLSGRVPAIVTLKAICAGTSCAAVKASSI
jgi:hypothetical protein